MMPDNAKQKVLAIGLIRLSGVALIMTAFLIAQGKIHWPQEIAYLLGLAGMFDAFVVPQMLARRWRSPRE